MSSAARSGPGQGCTAAGSCKRRGRCDTGTGPDRTRPSRCRRRAPPPLSLERPHLEGVVREHRGDAALGHGRAGSGAAAAAAASAPSAAAAADWPPPRDVTSSACGPGEPPCRGPLRTRGAGPGGGKHVMRPHVRESRVGSFPSPPSAGPAGSASPRQQRAYGNAGPGPGLSAARAPSRSPEFPVSHPRAEPPCPPYPRPGFRVPRPGPAPLPNDGSVQPGLPHSSPFLQVPLRPHIQIPRLGSCLLPGRPRYCSPPACKEPPRLYPRGSRRSSCFTKPTQTSHSADSTEVKVRQEFMA